MGKKIINENEIAMVEATGEVIANKIRSTIIDAHKLFNIDKPSFSMIASMLIIAIVDVVKDFADAHKVSLTEEMKRFTDALEYAAKAIEDYDNENKKGKEDNKEDGKERD